MELFFFLSFKKEEKNKEENVRGGYIRERKK